MFWKILTCPELCIVWLKHENKCLNGSLVYHEQMSCNPASELSNPPVMWVCDQVHWCHLFLHPLLPTQEEQLLSL